MPSTNGHKKTAILYCRVSSDEQVRHGYSLDQQAAGLMTLDELGSKLKELEDSRQAALSELAGLEAQEERVKELEEDRDALLEAWIGALPDAVDTLSGEERNKVYRLLRLEVTPVAEGYQMTGALGGFLHSGTATFKDTEGNTLQLYEPLRS